jgi:succinoglycan biosynthesis protein ExoM
MFAQIARRSLVPAAYMNVDAGFAPTTGSRWKPQRQVVVTLAVPTQRRPDGLMSAARSLFGQVASDATRLELVIVDNDAYPSAKPYARALAAEAPFEVRYVHEPRPGVAHARNAAVAAAKGELICFLDDDQQAAPGWLAALMQAQARFGADAVFGPVKAEAGHALGPHRHYLETFFSREGPSQSGVIAHAYGCGNSLMRRAALPRPPFSPDRNEIGGEDDHLFARLQRDGARFAWSSEALAFETPAPERQTLRYAMARAFAFGQGPTYGCATADPPDWLGVMRWMAVGLAQSAIFFPLAAGAFAVRAPSRAFILDRAVRGAGKVFFGGPFKMRFYGRPRDEGAG